MAMDTLRGMAEKVIPRILPFLSEDEPLWAREVSRLSGVGWRSTDNALKFMERRGQVRISMKKGNVAYTLKKC
jgi:hypothetical protein